MLRAFNSLPRGGGVAAFYVAKALITLGLLRATAPVAGCAGTGDMEAGDCCPETP